MKDLGDGLTVKAGRGKGEDGHVDWVIQAS